MCYCGLLGGWYETWNQEVFSSGWRKWVNTSLSNFTHNTSQALGLGFPGTSQTVCFMANRICLWPHSYLTNSAVCWIHCCNNNNNNNNNNNKKESQLFLNKGTWHPLQFRDFNPQLYALHIISEYYTLGGIKQLGCVIILINWLLIRGCLLNSIVVTNLCFFHNPLLQSAF